jgi:hypothetical protein
VIEDQHAKGFEISVEKDYILLRVEPGRTVTVDRLLGMLGEAYSLKAYRSESRTGLWDFRGCSSDLHLEGMTKIRDYVTSHYDPSWSVRFTALVGEGDLLYGLARMYEGLADRVPTILKVFRDFDEAAEWLRKKVV